MDRPKRLLIQLRGRSKSTPVCVHDGWMDLQGMAGNIVHAIATTNAIISGLIVVEAMKIVSGLQKSCKVGPGIAYYARDAMYCYTSPK